MKTFKTSLLVILILIFSNCTDDEDNFNIAYDRIVLIYMVAENNLSNESANNIKSIKNNILNNLGNNKLFVYVDSKVTEAELIEIYQENNKVKSRVVKKYISQNSASPEVLSQVIKDTFNPHEAKSSGLILWSHGSSWLPADPNLWTKSFGDDNSKKMEINELKQGLPDFFFDFIIFDACLMSSIEVAFELRNKTKYILASPTEVFGQGFPYHLIMDDLYSNKPLQESLSSIGSTYFSYYLSLGGVWKNVSIALLDTKRLNELSLLCKQVIDQKSSILGLNFENLQPLMYHNGNQKLLFDFRDYYSAIANESELQYLDQLLGEIVIYKNCSPFIYSSAILSSYPVTKYSGLSTFIPSNKTLTLNSWYFEYTEWAHFIYPE